MADTTKSVLLDILSNPYKASAGMQGVNETFNKANFDKMREAYNTCMNENAVKAYGVTPIVKLLDEFDKVYPENGPAPTAASRDELTKALVWLAQNNVAGLVGSSTTVSSQITHLFSRFVTVERWTTKHRIPSSSHLLVVRSTLLVISTTIPKYWPDTPQLSRKCSM